MPDCSKLLRCSRGTRTTKPGWQAGAETRVGCGRIKRRQCTHLKALPRAAWLKLLLLPLLLPNKLPPLLQLAASGTLYRPLLARQRSSGAGTGPSPAQRARTLAANMKPLRCSCAGG